MMEFGVGSIVDGKVTGITKFGAFVALPDGKSGLVHISEIAYSYVNEVSDYLHEGQEVKVKVISIDQANRINLSIKQCTPPPQRSPRPANGGQRFNHNNNGGGYRSNNGEGGYSHHSNGGYNHSNNGGYSHNGGYNHNGGYSHNGGGRPPRQGGSRSGGFSRQASKEPTDFEDRLKQFMQASDSKLSELRYLEKKGGNRRTGGHNNNRRP